MAIPFDMVSAILYEFARLGEGSIGISPQNTPIKIISANTNKINFNKAFFAAQSKNFYESKILDLPSLLFEMNSNHVVMRSPAKLRGLHKSHSRDEMLG
jgi:hypothetical protein